MKFGQGSAIVCIPCFKINSSMLRCRFAVRLSISGAGRRGPRGRAAPVSCLPNFPIVATPFRSLFHIPLGIGAKLVAAMTLKKVALVAIVNKIGVDKTLSHFRNINTFLFNNQQILGTHYRYRSKIHGMCYVFINPCINCF